MDTIAPTAQIVNLAVAIEYIARANQMFITETSATRDTIETLLKHIRILSLEATKEYGDGS